MRVHDYWLRARFRERTWRGGRRSCLGTTGGGTGGDSQERRTKRCSSPRGHVDFPRCVAHSAPAAAELGRSASEAQRMTRRHQRWVATGFIIAVGTVAVGAYSFGYAMQRLLLFGWLAPLFAVAYAAGVNVWAGGPFDWNNDQLVEDR